MDLEPHGPDTFVGVGPALPVGRPLRRPDRGPGAAGRGAHGRPDVPAALAARLLHPPRRPHRAHPLRGRPHPQRPLVRAPAGWSPASRSAPSSTCRPRSTSTRTRPTCSRCASIPVVGAPDDLPVRHLEPRVRPAPRGRLAAERRRLGPRAWMRMTEPVADDPLTAGLRPGLPLRRPPHRGGHRPAPDRRRWARPTSSTAPS